MSTGRVTSLTETKTLLGLYSIVLYIAYSFVHSFVHKKSAGGELIVEHSPKILAREEKATTT